MVRPSRGFTELFQTSLIEAEFDEDCLFDLHFEARGHTPEHKSSFWMEVYCVLHLQIGLQTPGLYFGASWISKIKEFFQEYLLHNQMISTNHLPNCLASSVAVFISFCFTIIDVFMAKSKIKWKSYWWFAIPVTCYCFGNGSAVPDLRIGFFKTNIFQINGKYLRFTWKLITLVFPLEAILTWYFIFSKRIEFLRY